MRKIIRRTLRVLDGTPQNYGEEPSKGQSIVELALVMPILLILLVGLVEIGYFARNYLTLLEVTRAGARRGATLQEEFSPLQWERNPTLRQASLAPVVDVDARFCTETPPPGSPPCYTAEERTAVINSRRSVRDCNLVAQGLDQAPAGFFNLVLCQMLDSLRPLQMRQNDVDDIVISVFSVLMINNRPQSQGGDINLSATYTIRDSEFNEEGYTPVVVGRWPIDANECNVWQDETSGSLFMYSYGSGQEFLIAERDPFDYFDQTNTANNNVSLVELVRFEDGAPVTELYPIELAESVPDPDNPGEQMWVSVGFDPYDRPEFQRGFSYLGQREITPVTLNAVVNGSDRVLNLRCWGSDWDVYRVQEQLLGGEFLLTAEELAANPELISCVDAGGQPVVCDQREFLPNNGIVLVEIFWQHELLLDIPVFSPVYNALDDNQTTIQVWSAFSTPTVVPRVRYRFSGNEFIVDPNE